MVRLQAEVSQAQAKSCLYGGFLDISHASPTASNGISLFGKDLLSAWLSVHRANVPLLCLPPRNFYRLTT